MAGEKNEVGLRFVERTFVYLNGKYAAGKSLFDIVSDDMSYLCR